MLFNREENDKYDRNIFDKSVSNLLIYVFCQFVDLVKLSKFDGKYNVLISNI